MALGYLGSVTGYGGVELRGRDYFNNLAMRSLFQEFRKSGDRWGEKIKWCKMHDIVHDFAQFLRKNNDTETGKRSCQVCDPFLVYQVQEYRSLFWDKGTPPDLCDCLTSLRVLRLKGILNGPPQGMEKLIHLRWLELSGTALSKEDLEIICRLYFLQTLLLADCSLKDIPGEIGNLVHLRHLDLSENRKLKELPESICSLLELQILNLNYCSNLYRLPEGINRLRNLQRLYTECTPASRRLPQGVGQLSGLRTLDWFHVGSGWNKLGLLKTLNRLTGYLKLEIHCSSMSDLADLVEDAREAELRNKIHIQTLVIVFTNEREWSSTRASSLWMDVIESLESYQKLNYLQIQGYKGSRLPHWISSPLNLLKEIDLFGFSQLSSLPAMGKLHFLELLNLNNMKELKVVSREFLGIECSSTPNHVVVVAFPKLKVLIFRMCSEWREWEDITVEEEESAAVSLMPCLTTLTINACASLKKLPHRLLRKASSLQILDIRSSSELEKSYGDDKDGSPWRSISQYNPHLQLSIPSG